MATTFSLKQGETRTSHGSISHPLKILNDGTFKARKEWQKANAVPIENIQV